MIFDQIEYLRIIVKVTIVIIMVINIPMGLVIIGKCLLVLIWFVQRN